MKIAIIRLLSVALLWMSFEALSIVIRHDVSDQEYRLRVPPLAAHVSFLAFSKDKAYMAGSGIYIGHGWVLTAAHVANFFEDTDRAEIGSERLAIKKAIVHENWRDRQFGFDIALVKIQPPKASVAPVSLFSYSLTAGDIVQIAGRGDSGNGLEGVNKQDRHMRVAENEVDNVEGQWLSFTFDSPDGDALPYEGVGGGGDSGGPAYLVKAGIPHIVGLSSWQDTKNTHWQEGRYGVKDYYTYIAHYKEWIQANMTD